MKPDPPKGMNEREAERIAYLVAGFMRQTLTEAEHDELDDWISASVENQRLFEDLTKSSSVEFALDEFDEPETRIALEKTKKRLQFSTPHRGVSKRGRLLWYSVAATLLLLVGLYFFYTRMNQNNSTIDPISLESTLKPGGNYAMLVLANGDTVNLSEAKNGLIDSSNGSDVMKTADGQLSYENPEARMLAYHELSTPVGGQFSVTLPDGSRVWLNSSSRLKYPVAFTGKTREIELEGEGYFEVKKIEGNDERGNVPFIVKVNGVEIQVLGTQFNVNAYKDEGVLRTTLIEGAVQVSMPTTIEPILMTPGQQFLLKNGEGEGQLLGNVDVEEAIAWKNGKFRFRDEPIENIMRQVGRWYGAEIVYENKGDFHFNATIFRNEPVEKLLDILEETGRVKFRIEGKVIYVRG